MNYKSVLFYLGIYSLLVSMFSILNILYSIYFNFILDLDSYIVTFSVSATIGLIFCYVGFKEYKQILLTEQLVSIVLTFTFIPFLISIPYYLSIYNINYLNAYFESVSGFTTTGFSIIKNVKNIDEPLLLWRASSQWLGGLIFLIFTIGTIGSKQIKIKPAYLISGGASGRNFYNNFNYNFIKILLIYFFLTILIIFLYRLLDMRLLDAFVLSFTTISSGGFLPVDSLSSIVATNFQIFILSITLLIPVFNFFLLHDIITRQFALKNSLEDLHLLIFIILITFFFYFFVIPNENISNVFFAVASSISTSGISIYTSNFDLSLFLILLTVIGGSLISTSSGFKYTRFYILLKISYQEIYRLVKPINIIDKKLFNTESKIDDQDVKIAFLVFISFIASVFILSSLLTFENINFEDSFKLSILTLTNTVNSTLYGTGSIDFFNLNTFTKVSLISFMILAKVEIIAVIYLFRKMIFKE
jgi:trk system potassium uptake protein